MRNNEQTARLFHAKSQTFRACAITLDSGEVKQVARRTGTHGVYWECTDGTTYVHNAQRGWVQVTTPAEK